MITNLNLFFKLFCWNCNVQPYVLKGHQGNEKWRGGNCLHCICIDPIHLTWSSTKSGMRRTGGQFHCAFLYITLCCELCSKVIHVPNCPPTWWAWHRSPRLTHLQGVNSGTQCIKFYTLYTYIVTKTCVKFCILVFLLKRGRGEQRGCMRHLQIYWCTWTQRNGEGGWFVLKPHFGWRRWNTCQSKYTIGLFA